MSETGCHRPPVAGIHGREKDVAYSIVLSGGYEDDVVCMGAPIRHRVKVGVQYGLSGSMKMMLFVWGLQLGHRVGLCAERGL